MLSESSDSSPLKKKAFKEDKTDTPTDSLAEKAIYKTATKKKKKEE